MEKKTLTLSIEINASKEKVWDVLLQDETYRKWTSVFSEGSHAETDWKEGGKVYFKDAKGQGLVSKIVEHKPNEIITIEHLGFLMDGKEDYDSEDVKNWQGMKETYKLNPKGADRTELLIEQELSPKDAEWFYSTWEKALRVVKELAEEG